MRYIALLAALFFLTPVSAEARKKWTVYPVSITSSGNNADGTCTNNGVPRPCCNGPSSGTCNNVLDNEDIEDALNAAYADPGPNGVVIQLPEGTCDACEITIAGYAGSTGRAGNGYINGFPRGLWIRGRGASTIMKSSIPPRRDTGNSRDALIVFNVQSNSMHGDLMKNIRISDIIFDGVSPEQPSPTVGDAAGHKLIDNGASWPGSLANSLMKGFDFFNPGLGFTDPIQKIYVFRSTFQNFIAGAGNNGVSSGLPMSETGGKLYFMVNTISNVGCHNDSPNGFTGPTTGIIRCGCLGAHNGTGIYNSPSGTGAGTNCSGWNDEPDATAQPGLKSSSIGIDLAAGKNDLVSNNIITKTTKYGSQLFASGNLLNTEDCDPAGSTGPPVNYPCCTGLHTGTCNTDPWYRTPDWVGYGASYIHNKMSWNHVIPLGCNSCNKMIMRGNTYDHAPGMPGATQNTLNGNGTNGNNWIRNIFIYDEVSTSPGGNALQVTAAHPTNAGGARIRNVSIADPCSQWADEPTGTGATINASKAIRIVPETIFSTQLGSSNLRARLENVSVTGANNCAFALVTGYYESTATTPRNGVIDPLVILNGSYKVGQHIQSPTGIAGCGTTPEISCVTMAQNISATGVALVGDGVGTNDDQWIWSNGGPNVGSTGTCSGFALSAGAVVVNNDAVGTCVP